MKFPDLNLRRIVIFVFVLAVTPRCGGKSNSNEVLNSPDSLVIMERSFSQYATDHTTRDAFLRFLSDSSVLFKPGPVNGKQFWSSNEDKGELLYWQPAFVGVSSRGDLGFTTGPYFLQPSRMIDSVRYFGHYMSVWKKEGDHWRVLIDMGVGHGAADMSPIPVLASYTGTGGTYADMIELENQYQQDYAEQQIRNDMFSKDCILLRPRQLPVRSVEGNESFLKGDDLSFAYGSPVGFISDSGELGVTYGDAEVTVHTDNDRKVGLHFVRIWAFDQSVGWKIVLDIIGS